MTLFERIAAANAAIRPEVPVTPLDRSAGLSAALGCEVLLKAEHLLPTSSFKLRGATSKLKALGPEASRTGVVTASTGNHGQAVAWAGARLGIPVVVYVAASAARPKVEAISLLGAELVLVDGPPIEAELQAPDLDAVFVAVGGGGLVGGVGTALKGLGSQARVVGAWAENSPCMLRAIEAGEIVDVDEAPTLSDGTAGAVEPGSVTLPICQAAINDTVTVSEVEIARAMRRIAEAERWIIEGAAGVAVAGLVKQATAYQGRKVAVVLCGRNIALEAFLCAVAHAEEP